jgi:hypothetical protein
MQLPSDEPHPRPPLLQILHVQVGEHDPVDGQWLQGSGSAAQARVGEMFADTPATSAAHWQS